MMSAWMMWSGCLPHVVGVFPNLEEESVDIRRLPHVVGVFPKEYETAEVIKWSSPRSGGVSGA